MDVSSLTISSCTVSVTGIGLTTYLTWRTWRRHVTRPSTITSWRFIASLALLVAFLALLTSATGSVLVQSDAFSGDTAMFMRHLALMLRGGFLALAIAVVYGWTHIERNGEA